jgi:MFS transporter, ACS family, tartrate transporter
MNSINLSVESSVIKKTMLRILPFVFICYVIAYLDRVNIGFAALEMNADLALSAEIFGLLSGIFFLGYVVFEIPSNMIMSKVGARFWIARIMITWGIIETLTGFVQNSTHLYIARFLLGIAEAGFFPGIILYFTYWFRGKERGRASAFLLLALPVGTIIGAPLSTWIMDTITWGGLAGWRWMFILEGIPAVALGVITLFFLSNRPKDAKWLSDEEKNWLEQELDRERQQSLKVNKVSKLAMVKDFNVWKLALVYFANVSAMFGISFWLPTIIKSLSEGSSNMEIGWLSIIPALVGIPAMLLFAWSSDKKNERKKHIITSFLFAAVGYIFAGFSDSTFIMIASLTFAAIGLYGFAGIFFAFLPSFFTVDTAPAGIAMVNALGLLGGFFGPMIFGQFEFTSGMFTLGGLAILASIILLSINTNKVDTKTSTEILKPNPINPQDI